MWTDPIVADSLDLVSMGAGVDILTGNFFFISGDVFGVDFRGCCSDLVDSASGNWRGSVTRVSTDARFDRRLLRLPLVEFWPLPDELAYCWSSGGLLPRSLCW